MKSVTSTKQLLGLSSASLSQDLPNLSRECLALAGELGGELMGLLRTTNGFYAFENALHFFPARTSLLSVGIEEWNAASSWREEYGNLANGCLFFAEDVFGGQFCIFEDRVWSFDPETGERTEIGSTLDDWARAILNDYRVLTGHPLAHAWQVRYGTLPEGMRLVPRVPFVCNGAFSIENISVMDAEKAMRIRGGLARQIQGLPDGASITFTMDR